MLLLDGDRHLGLCGSPYFTCGIQRTLIESQVACWSSFPHHGHQIILWAYFIRCCNLKQRDSTLAVFLFKNIGISQVHRTNCRALSLSLKYTSIIDWNVRNVFINTPKPTGFHFTVFKNLHRNVLSFESAYCIGFLKKSFGFVYKLKITFSIKIINFFWYSLCFGMLCNKIISNKLKTLLQLLTVLRVKTKGKKYNILILHTV